MKSVLDLPLAVFALSMVAMWLSIQIGVSFRKRVLPLKEGEEQDFNLVIPATLTLLGLIIGFSFSMVSGRYDQRKNYEEAEANAIGTEYARADLLPAEDGLRVRELLRKYIDQRILFYRSDGPQIGELDSDAAKLQAELWSTVVHVASAQSTPVVALAIAGMNDVLNSQGYTQAAWWNRLPIAAWALIGLFAISTNLLLGYREHRTDLLVLLVVPVISSIAFFLIADIDSPNGGVIRVVPHNLMAVAQSMKAQ